MRTAIVILCLIAGTARAQFFTPAEVQWLDFRYGSGGSAGGLNTNTMFGNNVTGRWNALDVVLSTLGPRLAGTGLTARASGMLDVTISGSSVTADTTTITNNGSGQFSVKNYDTNAIAKTIYQRNARDSWNDYAESHINGATWDETTNGGVLAVTWAQLTGP